MENNNKTIKLTQDEASSLISILEEFKDTITYLPNSNKINNDIDDHEKWRLRFINSVQEKLG